MNFFGGNVKNNFRKGLLLNWLYWVQSTMLPVKYIVIEIKRVLKLYRHKQKIYINQFVLVTSSRRQQCSQCPARKSKDNVKRIIFALDPCWFIHQRAHSYSSHSQVSMRVEPGCLFTFEHHQLIKVDNVTTELKLFFSSEIIDCVLLSQGYLPVIPPVPRPPKVHQGQRQNLFFTGLAKKKRTFPSCLYSNALDRFDTFVLS